MLACSCPGGLLLITWWGACLGKSTITTEQQLVQSTVHAVQGGGGCVCTHCWCDSCHARLCSTRKHFHVCAGTEAGASSVRGLLLVCPVVQWWQPRWTVLD